jgi:hypothetical protein
VTFPAPFRATTSHRIEMTGPGRLRKDLSNDGWISGPETRPPFLHCPGREPSAYRALLGPLGIGPRCTASGCDWVEIEFVRGVELWQIEDLAVWAAAARALATTHHRLRDRAGCDVPFVVHDAHLAATWRMRAAASGMPAHVIAAHERAWEERLLALPATVIHGDSYASNVLVRRDGPTAEPDLVFIDWELVGIGPAVLDLAALTAGSWPEEAVDAMTRAYFETADDLSPSFSSWEERRSDLDAARLHLCVQWSGWAGGWRPPKAHRRDWVRDACAIVDRQTSEHRQ